MTTALSYREARLLQQLSDRERRRVVADCVRESAAGRVHSGRPARRRRRADAAARLTTPALALAQRTIGSAAFTCSGCGAWLFRASDIVGDRDRECDVTLTDSVATVCTPASTWSTYCSLPRTSCTHSEYYIADYPLLAGARRANVTVSPEVHVYERHSSEAWEFKKANVTCSNCGLFLGIKIESGTRIAAAEMRAEHTFADFGPRREGCEIVPSVCSSLVGADATAASFEVEHGLASSFEVEGGRGHGNLVREVDSLHAGLDIPRRRRLGRSGMRKLRSAASSAAAAVRDLRQKLREKKADWEGNERTEPASPRRAIGGTLLSAERVTFEVDQLYFGLRYLRMQDSQTGCSKFEQLPLCCRGCSNVLSHSDQVLCTERRWGFRGVTSPEPSMYVNSLLLGSTKVTPVSRMALGQGDFDMCDVTCSTCERRVGYRFCGAVDSHNINHVGRAGLVLSCVHLLADEHQAAALSTGSRKLSRRRSRQGRPPHSQLGAEIRPSPSTVTAQ